MAIVVMENEPRDMLSIIIVNYNTREYVQNCLRSIEKHPPNVPYEVIVVDNASSDGSADAVAESFPHCRLIRSQTNDGYGVAINRAVPLAAGNWLMFLNPDMEVGPKALEGLISFAKSHSGAGVVSPKLMYGTGEPQPSARRFLSSTMLLIESLRLHLLIPAGMRGRIFLSTYFPQNETREAPWVSGACHLIPRHVFEAVGPLTEETFCGSDDYDYCYRVRQRGYSVWLYAEASMTHYCSVAVRQRWNVWEVEQVAIHNFYVVLESHWPPWKLKIYYLAEMLSYMLEAIRHKLHPRFDELEANRSYFDRLKKRFALDLDFLLGRQKPIRRFQPPGAKQPA